jgi:dihydroorotate dehydrogenase electron transfer subunit
VAQLRLPDGSLELVLHAPEIASDAQPGQFVELLYGHHFNPLIRRPFSICAVDRAAGYVTQVYRSFGAFTSGLMQLTSGDPVSLIGPLGQPFRWDASEGIRHILVAGGFGVPPMCFLAAEMCAGSEGTDATVINAARSASALIGMPRLEQLPIELITITDDGSHGRQGVAPELLAEILAGRGDTPCRVYACGPMPMLRAVAQVSMAASVPCQVSVETSMPCGTGICWGCAVAVQDRKDAGETRYVRACVSGPVFEAAELVW